MSKHAQQAKQFLRNKKQAAWHDETLWLVREKRDRMAHQVPEWEQLREAAKSAVCKINIDSDSRLAMTAAIRKHFAEHPEQFDPRQYLKPARQAIKEMVAHKIVDVLGCDGKAAYAL